MDSLSIPKNRKIIIIAVIIVGLLIWGAFSLKKANAPVDSVSPELGYVGFSPKGFFGGAIVPASCESGYYEHYPGECGGWTYSIFGIYPPGTSPGGGEPAPASPGPSAPAPQCLCSSPANSCGMVNRAYADCGIPSCPTSVPSDNDCATPTLAIGSIITSGLGTINNPQSSQTVNQGDRCNIYWNASPATSCRVTGPGLNYSNGASGQVNTPPIQATSVYTITCYNGNVISASRNFTCRLNPKFEEAK